MKSRLMLYALAALASLTLVGCGANIPSSRIQPAHGVVRVTRAMWMVPISGMSMISTNTGWGTGHGRVWRTVDGGRTWVPVFSTATNGISTTSDFVSSDVAVVAQGFVGHIRISLTDDGGERWNYWTLELPSSVAVYPMSLSFVSDKTGWILVAPEQGMNSSEGWLFRTVDGGKRWTLVSSTSAGTLPSARGMIRFRGSGEGWLAASVGATGKTNLYRSVNDGAKWIAVTLKDPKSYVVVPSLPMTWGRQGVLTAALSSPAGVISHGRAAVFHTKDGGRVWLPVGEDISRDIEPSGSTLNPQFLTPESGYAVIGHELCWTLNGGRTWQRLVTIRGGFSPASLNVVSARKMYLLLEGPSGQGWMESLRPRNSGS